MRKRCAASTSLSRPHPTVPRGKTQVMTSIPPSLGCSTKGLALIGLAVSEKMFQYYGHIHVHVYSPRAGADNPLGTKYFLKHKSSVHLIISSKFSAI